VLGHVPFGGISGFGIELLKVVRKQFLSCETITNKLGPELFFSGECKVDYVNNNISKCFNNWIKECKGLHVDALMDTIRDMIMEKIVMRQVIAQKLEGPILPSVINELKMKSRNLKYTIKGSGGLKAEVSGLTKDNYPWRHAVDLELKTCSCGQWRISGKPCTHAICLIGSLR
jgi:hypothetical protein